MDRAVTSSALARACHCVIVSVALDETGRPRSVPIWQPGSPVEVALDQSAMRLAGLNTETASGRAWLDQEQSDARQVANA